MSNSQNIRTGIIQGIIDLALPYPIKWPNAEFDTPDSGTWVRVSVIMGSPSASGLHKTDRVDGFIQFDVFTDLGSGDLKVYEIADTIRQGLPHNGQSLDSGGVSVRFESVGINGGLEPVDGWNRAIIECRFFAYVDRTI